MDAGHRFGLDKRKQVVKSSQGFYISCFRDIALSNRAIETGLHVLGEAIMAPEHPAVINKGFRFYQKETFERLFAE